MARLLGYETYYVEGQVPLASGGMGPHGWCEIVIDGFTYVFLIRTLQIIRAGTVSKFIMECPAHGDIQIIRELSRKSLTK